MRYVKCFLAMVLMLCVFCSCTNEENRINIQISPEDKTLTDLATEIYTDEQLLNISQFNGSTESFCSRYPFECVRKLDIGYRVSFLGDDRITVIILDSDCNKISGTVYKTLCQKSDFDDLSEGEPIESVQAIDKNGEYLFLLTGRNDTPRISKHYTKDGYLISIEYDVNNTILNINEELI